MSSQNFVEEDELLTLALCRPTLERVILAAKSYKAFMDTRPNVIQKNSNPEQGYQLIRNLQRMLRLYSLWRDGRQIRAMIADAKVADAIAALFQPLADFMCHLQRIPGSEEKLLQFGEWLQQLLDLCEALRSWIQDPARSVAAIASHLESGLEEGYTFLHQVAIDAPDLLPFHRIYMFLQDLRSDGALFDLPAEAEMPSSSHSTPTTTSNTPTGDLRATVSDIEALTRKHLLRAQEIFARWIVGDCEEEHSILTIGDMAGKTRKEPFFPRELPAKLHLPALDSLLPTFRAACHRALDACGIAT